MNGHPLTLSFCPDPAQESLKFINLGIRGSKGFMSKLLVRDEIQGADDYPAHLQILQKGWESGDIFLAGTEYI